MLLFQTFHGQITFSSLIHIGIRIAINITDTYQNKNREGEIDWYSVY